MLLPRRVPNEDMGRSVVVVLSDGLSEYSLSLLDDSLESHDDDDDDDNDDNDEWRRLLGQVVLLRRFLRD